MRMVIRAEVPLHVARSTHVRHVNSFIYNDFTGKLQPLVLTGRQDAVDQIVETRLKKRVARVFPQRCKILRSHARLLCKRCAEPQEVDDRIFVAHA